MARVQYARFLWTGAVRHDGFAARVEIQPDETLLLAESLNATPIALSTSSIVYQGVRAGIDKTLVSIAAFNVTGLKPATAYFIGVRKAASTLWFGSTKTFPEEGTPAKSLSFAIASCAMWENDAYRTYDRMAQHDPAFFINHGDLFYSDITVDSNTSFRDAYRAALLPVGTQRFFATYPVMYIYDDHDFGTNNANSSSPSRPAALWAFHTFYPHYPLKTIDDNIVGFQTFTVGRIRFIITDLRSQSTKLGGRGNWTVMGTTQRNWFFAELEQFQSYKMIVWVSSRPWNGNANDMSEEWSGYSVEREMIANKIANLKINNLVMLAGDAHMLAIDDGRNTDFSVNGGAGFPLLHSAPILNLGNVKGGNFSHGCYGYRLYPNYHYSIVNITDTTIDGVCITLAAYTISQNEPMISYTTCPKCTLPLCPVWIWTVLAITFLLMNSVIITMLSHVFQKCNWWPYKFKKDNDDDNKNIKSSKTNLTSKKNSDSNQSLPPAIPDSDNDKPVTTTLKSNTTSHNSEVNTIVSIRAVEELKDDLNETNK